MNAPLAGVHVVECASFVAGPVGGMTLAQLGADVVRVDPIGGRSDRYRWPVAPSGDSYYWTSLNKGKRSVQVDLRSERGRELAIALITATGTDRGVLIDNAVGQRWLAHERLAARRSDLVHVRVQGHPDGRPAVDYTVNAEVGVPGITGPEDVGAPINHVLPAWDLLTGMTAVTGVLAALRDRDRTGRGTYLEVALADVALSAVANLGWLSEAAARGAERPRHGNHVYGSFGVDFSCRDGQRVMIVALTDGQWKALCSVTGTAAVFAALESALDVDLTREVDRYRLRETIAAVLRPWFADRDREQASKQLEAARVLWGPYRGMVEVVAAHRAGGHAVLADVELADGSTSVTGRRPLRWDGEHGEPGQVPRLGEHTSAVFAEVLGLSSAEIGRLVADGVLADDNLATPTRS